MGDPKTPTDPFDQLMHVGQASARAALRASKYYKWMTETGGSVYKDDLLGGLYQDENGATATFDSFSGGATTYEEALKRLQDINRDLDLSLIHI